MTRTTSGISQTINLGSHKSQNSNIESGDYDAKDQRATKENKRTVSTTKDQGDHFPPHGLKGRSINERDCFQSPNQESKDSEGAYSFSSIYSEGERTQSYQAPSSGRGEKTIQYITIVKTLKVKALSRRLMPIKKLCQIFGFSDWFVYESIKTDPKHPFINVGRKKCFKASPYEVQNWLQEIKKRQKLDLGIKDVNELLGRP